MGKKSRDLCSPSNIPAALQILNSELDTLDMRPIPSQPGDGKELIVNLINRCYELALAVMKNNVLLNDRLVELLRLQTAAKNDLKERDRLESALKNERNKFEDLTVKLKYVDEELHSAGKEIKAAKKEIARLQRARTLQASQHKLEIRRRNELVDGLQKKIHRLINMPQDEVQITPLGGQSPAISRSRKNVILDSQYDEILDMYVCHLHNNIQIVLDENVAYRTLLESINDKLAILTIDTPLTWRRLAGLPCRLAVECVEKHFEAFLSKLDEKETIIKADKCSQT
ncbi:Hypothetical protein NTJ_06470 [Nesidiocoris tenuis]|uniref:Uncharacterized protein n=2 Tax=Nesidiocoris tenuis TaxID=355587 RepID=A0ABN7ARY8_9HEMI|nr:Hypothetical protein NTJ_06470 [Nesidiocoris tenuis]